MTKFVNTITPEPPTRYSNFDKLVNWDNIQLDKATANIAINLKKNRSKK